MATATNANNIDFAAGSAGQDANAWRLYNAASSGTELWRGTLSNNPDALGNNEYFRINAGALTLTLTMGSSGGTAAAALRAIDGFVSSNIWVELYNGNTSVSNRVQLSSGDWTTAQ